MVNEWQFTTSLAICEDSGMKGRSLAIPITQKGPQEKCQARKNTFYEVKWEFPDDYNKVNEGMLNAAIIILILLGLIVHRYLTFFWEQGLLPYFVKKGV
jgi:hypothetical protein